LKILKTLFKNNLFYGILFNFRVKQNQNKEIKKWNSKGNPLPPPHEYKQRIITEYSMRFRLKTFVETGTFMGFMIEIMKYRFKKIISIELDQKLFESVTAKFLNEKKITILQGDSSKVLPVILKELNEPTLFWLDGHYSEGITAKGDLNTPILGELKSILTHHVDDHVVLVDDARCFTGKNDYPTIAQLETYVRAHKQGLSFTVENDIIRIHNN